MGRNEKTVVIEVKGGCVIGVFGLPDNYDYEIIDRDLGQTFDEDSYHEE